MARLPLAAAPAGAPFLTNFGEPALFTVTEIDEVPGRSLPILHECNASAFGDAHDGLTVNPTAIPIMSQTRIDLGEDGPSLTALVAQLERLNHALDATGSGIWDWNCRTGEMFFSPPWYQLLGYEPGGLPGRAESFFDRIHPEDAERAKRDLDEHLIGRTPVKQTEMQLRTKSGEFRWFLDQGKVVARDESGRPIRLVGTLTDITGRKDAEQERARLQAQLGQTQKMDAIETLAGGIAHDFNNLLTGILGFVDLVREDLPDDHITRPWLEDVVGAGARAKALLQQMLTLSRSGTCQRTPFHLEEAIVEAMGTIRSGLSATVRLEQEILLGSPPILGDPAQIHQVLLALVTNALQALPADGGTIAIGLARHEITGELAARHPLLRAGPGARLTVSDNGCGMDADTLGRIFEPFFTARKTGNGTGLGLAIVYGIVQAHAAAIEAQSAPGRGTTFTLYFPATPFETGNPGSPGWASLPEGNGEHPLRESAPSAVQPPGREF